MKRRQKPSMSTWRLAGETCRRGVWYHRGGAGVNMAAANGLGVTWPRGWRTRQTQWRRGIGGVVAVERQQ